MKSIILMAIIALVIVGLLVVPACNGNGNDVITEFDLTMAVSPTTGGVTTPEAGTTKVAAGATVDITAEALGDYEFLNWSASPAVDFALGPNEPEGNSFTMPPSNVEVTANFALSDVEWAPDGVITPGEYTDVKVYGDYEIHWATDEQYIYVGMRAETGGWVAVGFDATPGQGMANADMVLGVVDGDDVIISDEFGTGRTTHRPDAELGGTDDILEYGGTEQGGFMVIEFKRALDTGDPYDAVLTEGTMTIIWAYSDSKSLTDYHSANRGYGEITL